MENLYSNRNLLDRLKKEGLPSSITSLIRYEKMGILPEPHYVAKFKDRSWGFYSATQIEEIVSIIKSYRLKRKKDVCTIEGCSRKYYAKGFCRNHYVQRRGVSGKKK